MDDAIERMASILRTAHHSVAFTGAGISTPSGIPDFRSRQGLWSSADPARVASLGAFRQQPAAHYDWLRGLMQLAHHAHPNPAHTALVQLQTLANLRAVITQNIDSLHQHAGTHTVHEIHGHMRTMTCPTCSWHGAAAPYIDALLQSGQLPRCKTCGAILKTAAVLFGEDLPRDVFNAARTAAMQCDVMLVVGSSLEVRPASDLPLFAMQHGAQLIIVNLTPTDLDDRATCVIHGDAAIILPQIVDRLEAEA